MEQEQERSVELRKFGGLEEEVAAVRRALQLETQAVESESCVSPCRG
jgi:hypothetical protein